MLFKNRSPECFMDTNWRRSLPQRIFILNENQKQEKSYLQAESSNTTADQDFGEEEAEKGNAKGFKEGISLGKNKGGLIRRTFPGRKSKRGTDRLKFG